MRKLFSSELGKLHEQFLEMGVNTSEQIYQATKAFTTHDKTLAKEVVENDQSTNGEEVHLEKEAFDFIALQQPVATDLRIIMVILKASSDLERIGDHAVTIAQETIRGETDLRLPIIEKNIADMTVQIRRMLEMALDSYIRNDEKAARQVADEDLIIDKHYVITRNMITDSVQNGFMQANTGSSYLMVDRMLERIGDHIVNLAEWTVYIGTGEMVELNRGKRNPGLVEELIEKDKSERNT
ncbi:phosphate signaling complex protein PhoU [Companilactobacillus mishanensis]|uniref:Phosphate-specific transport system accessory protein PhoU n=1 Tax=Companilactobacillus mishanensis TaxID=2486008 RepID=A0A5P0ZIZ5_9LACO|nr:phosphate signaling complex protein PhoU [Companilactobacillus mishanensis]MQS53081.1 phosphate signaling complex protein PhoU [Companilactobacillus mishanensis]MQS89760.1 phosphate signaling complex protein PhoU [Companilactobacillus mishanensis]